MSKDLSYEKRKKIMEKIREENNRRVLRSHKLASTPPPRPTPLATIPTMAAAQEKKLADVLKFRPRAENEENSKPLPRD